MKGLKALRGPGGRRGGAPPAAAALALAALAVAAACDSVDLGAPPADVNACRPSQVFFYEVWDGFLGKDYPGGKHCYDASCHSASSGRQLRLPKPTSMPGSIPMPPDWAAVYKSASEQTQCTNVRSSPLLTRPDGRQTHGGDKLIDPAGPEALLVEQWVVARP